MTTFPLCRWIDQLGARARALETWAVGAGVVLLTCVQLGSPALARDVAFSTAPTTAQAARTTLPDRQEKTTRYMACGNELALIGKLNNITKGPGDPLPEIIGKMLWLILNPTTPTGAGKPDQPPDDGFTPPKYRDDSDDARVILIQMTTDREAFPGANCESPADIPPEIKPEGVDAWIANTNADFSNGYDQVTILGCAPPGCLNLSQCRQILVRDGPGAKFVVTPSCMQRQINVVLSRIKVTGQAGSSDLPCHVFGGTTKGEWDVVVRDLTRVFYLNARNSERRILFDDVATYVQEKLLTLDGPPGLASYSLFQCGNQEEHTGSAQDRADERSWLGDTVDSVADIWKWLALRLALLIALLAAGALLAAVLGALSPALAALVTTLLAVLGTMIAFGRFPETENHRLNIETSRYLKNQQIIADLRNDDPSRFELDQIFVKQFLMSKFQDILKNDFQEYNARPYSRYSLLSIQNIAQFADDPELNDAARMVLTFTMAKAAVGSSGGLRLVPYRRHMEALRSKGFVSLLDNVSNGDHVIPMMQFFTGQTQQLPGNIVPGPALEPMIYYASGVIGPNPLVADDVILEAAIEKTRRYEQRIKSAGAEVYSGGDGWLVTAGGIQSGPANVFIAPINTGIKKLFKDDDRGAAWPTTLMLTAAAVKDPWWEGSKPMEDFLRIEGLKIVHEVEPESAGRDRALNDQKLESITSIHRERGHWRGQGIKLDPATQQRTTVDFAVPDNTVETFEGNLCVGAGFACGFNLEFPEPFASCGETRPGGWTFFDTDKCYPTAIGRGTRAFIAAFRVACPHPTLVSNKCRTFGLFEVISFNDPALSKLPEAERFQQFITLVLENTGLGASRGSVLSSIEVEAHGTYRAVKQNAQGARQSIAFEAELSEDSSLARIVSIDGNERRSHGSWNIAEDDFIRGDSNGRIEIGWRSRPDGAPPGRLILDLSKYRPDLVDQ
jgi:hypothetical protein